MENSSANKKKLEEVFNIVKTLRKELDESYFILKTSFNPLKNIDILDDKRKVIKEITEKIKEFGNITADNEDESKDIKEAVRAEIFAIAELNAAFSGLIKKNIYYNQLTISSIADAFNKNSIYDRGGANDSNFFPLKNVLLKHGVRV